MTKNYCKIMLKLVVRKLMVTLIEKCINERYIYTTKHCTDKVTVQ